MTGEDAIKLLQATRMMLLGEDNQPVSDLYDALEMAISALEQEPCNDAISREAVLDKLNEWDWQDLYLPIHFKEYIIDELPSVQPSRKVIEDIKHDIENQLFVGRLTNPYDFDEGLKWCLEIINKHTKG